MTEKRELKDEDLDNVNGGYLIKEEKITVEGFDGSVCIYCQVGGQIWSMGWDSAGQHFKCNNCNKLYLKDGDDWYKARKSY